MTRRLAPTLGVFVVAACSQLAGFEELSGDEPTDGGSNGAGTTSAGGAASGSGGATLGGAQPAGGTPNTPQGGRTPGGAGGSAGSRMPRAGSGGSSPGAGTGAAPSGGTSIGGSSPGNGGESDGAGSGGLGEGGAVGGCERQLVRNADFERGREAWTEDSDYAPNYRIIKPGSDAKLVGLGVQPRAGENLAWLGGFPEVEDRQFESTLTQDVTIPLETGVLRMTGYVWIITEDPDRDADGFVMELQDGDGVPWQIHYWFNQDATSGWAPFDYTVSDERLELLRGKTVTLFMQSRQDGALATSFFVDSLRLVASCGL